VIFVLCEFAAVVWQFLALTLKPSDVSGGMAYGISDWRAIALGSQGFHLLINKYLQDGDYFSRPPAFFSSACASI